MRNTIFLVASIVCLVGMIWTFGVAAGTRGGAIVDRGRLSEAEMASVVGGDCVDDYCLGCALRKNGAGCNQPDPCFGCNAACAAEGVNGTGYQSWLDWPNGVQEGNDDVLSTWNADCRYIYVCYKPTEQPNLKCRINNQCDMSIFVADECSECSWGDWIRNEYIPTSSCTACDDYCP